MVKLSRRKTTKSRDSASTGAQEASSIGAETQAQAQLPKIVSLFAGAGGLDLGFHYHGFSIPIAIDISSAAIKTHQKNFKQTHGVVGDLIALGPIGVLNHVASQIAYGQRIGIIGGPPCQGFSRGNVKSRADDPRNELPALYTEIIRTLQAHYTVDFVVFENVLGMKDQKHLPTFRALLTALNKLNLDVVENELSSLEFGVPQNRKRIILTGLRRDQNYKPLTLRKRQGPKTVKEAIGDLPDPVFFSRGLSPETFPVHPNHWTMKPKSKRFTTPVESTGRSFRRLCWDKASPTIAFGHREIHVHPTGSRRLSIYEAMLLQGFPKDFVLEGNLSEQVAQISNAVPPPLAKSIAGAIKSALSHKV